jgi:hypothetical protein
MYQAFRDFAVKERQPMTTYKLIIGVMFAVYVTNFISAFLANFMANWSPRARVFVDVLFGVILFVVLVGS